MIINYDGKKKGGECPNGRKTVDEYSMNVLKGGKGVRREKGRGCIAKFNPRRAPCSQETSSLVSTCTSRKQPAQLGMRVATHRAHCSSLSHCPTRPRVGFEAGDRTQPAEDQPSVWWQ